MSPVVNAPMIPININSTENNNNIFHVQYQLFGMNIKSQ